MSSHPNNEPILDYEPGSSEKEALLKELNRQMEEVIEIPCIINGEKIYTNNTVTQVIPHNHSHIIANVHLAGKKEIEKACQSAIEAQKDWIELGMDKRAQIFEKCAELLAGKWRMKINASTMLNQSKTAFQAEIDAACELIDFWKFNAHYVREFHEQYQPLVSPEGNLNTTEIRPLEGFVLAVTPFNFTSIAANLPSAPAMVGCTALWKPSRNSYHSNYLLMELMMEAGLPAGVINFLPGSGSEITETCLSNPDFAGLHFTGSTAVFQGIWQRIAEALPNLRSYPRIVGETGGKDFVVAHPDCDTKGLLVALLRGAFEYQGQKCSAASRAYVPKSVWEKMGDDLVSEVDKIKMGDASDFSNFMTAVIDERAFDKISGYINRASKDSNCEIIAGGNCSNESGWFIEPTIILTKNPDSETMVEEIFGPVLTVYVYEDNEFDEVLDLCDKASPYALTGSIFSTNEENILKAYNKLRFTAGNFYINDKPTGAVVGQQPFGGARASGTNDKAGGPLNLLRWISPRSVKRNNLKIHDWKYPFMGEN
ncbi:MAG: 1-pyrroline-5-carboxylate dehydrogenase [Marine Group III euryarchaeote CG-Epi4]|uniref:L-glutamate gamma-semialdehyde dehydrogenase n=1 Tax=Marine Group III euryarchaeote CG-Epi4 TaxID=1888998 RepID=A0A1J5TIZ7_9ARCH|nr:MAG: 1-pyrroline-5-carboxylate dehydrogenase [Marine Group III euryarchaeote CG-Epi4]